MSRFGLFIVIIVLSGCISIGKYNALEHKQDSINVVRKSIRKELSSLEKDIKLLQDSILKLKETSVLQSTQIEKRLWAKNIIVKLDPDALKKLSVRNQDFTNDFYSSWIKDKNLKDTNSAKTTTWMNFKEIKLVYWLNKARLNPKVFCMTYIYPLYLEDKNNVYIATLMDYMLTMKPLPALFPDKSLYESAICHAKTTGNAGIYGHQRMDGCKSKFAGECCSYGLSDPLAVVIQLLVDEHVTSLGHRYICLGNYTKIGIAFQPHKTFGTNVVLDFDY